MPSFLISSDRFSSLLPTIVPLNLLEQSLRPSIQLSQDNMRVVEEQEEEQFGTRVSEPDE